MKYIYILVTALTYIQLSHGILFFFYFFEIFILVTALTYIQLSHGTLLFFLLFLELEGEQLATERREAPVGENDNEDDEDGKRGATWKMLKNQGLKAHKKVKQRREKEVIFIFCVVFFLCLFSLLPF